MTGIRRLIENWLGPWALPVLDFYSDHSLAINLIVVLYGLLLMVSWFNLDRIRRELVSAVAAQVNKSTDSDDRASLERALAQVEIPWQSAVSQARFPLVAEQWSFRLRPASVEHVRAVLSPDSIIDEALGVLLGEKPRTAWLRQSKD